jgi:hypothetical protein
MKGRSLEARWVKEKRGKKRENPIRIIPSEFSKNSGRKKNSGMSSFTSVVESELESRHVVCREWNVRSGISKLWSENEYSAASATGIISLRSLLNNVSYFKLSTFLLILNTSYNDEQRVTMIPVWENTTDLFWRSCTLGVIKISKFYNYMK